MEEGEDVGSKDLNQPSTTKIYSKKAIFGFSTFFSPVFGGFLLRQNLIDSNRRKEANIALLVSIFLTAFTMLIMNGFHIKGGSFAYFLNMIGGIILSEYFFKRNFPNDNYEYKKIWKALLISIAVTAPFLLAMIFAPAE